MKIDKADVERIIDALETKSEETYKSSNRYESSHHYNQSLSNYYLGQSEAFDHAIAVLKLMLHD